MLCNIENISGFNRYDDLIQVEDTMKGAVVLLDGLVFGDEAGEHIYQKRGYELLSNSLRAAVRELEEIKNSQNKIFNNLHYKSDRYIFGKVMGPGMEITYNDGDTIIADTKQRNCKDGGIFMLDIDKCPGTTVARVILYGSGAAIIYEDYNSDEIGRTRIKEIVSKEDIEKFIIGKIVGHVSREVFE
jgi:phage repressor protein C with HTH and peptisase S24 domain